MMIKLTQKIYTLYIVSLWQNSTNRDILGERREKGIMVYMNCYFWINSIYNNAWKLKFYNGSKVYQARYSSSGCIDWTISCSYDWNVHGSRLSARLSHCSNMYPHPPPCWGGWGYMSKMSAPTPPNPHLN